MTDRLLAQKIWLAGLGALARAEKEGNEWLETLMDDGAAYEQERTAELIQALDHLRAGVADSQRRIRHQLGDIEQAFEHKVSTALNRVGLVSRSELTELQARIARLEAELLAATSEN